VLGPVGGVVGGVVGGAAGGVVGGVNGVFGIYPHRYHPATIGAELKEAPSGFLSWLSIAALNVVVLPTALS
jgi:hypothetical protein